MYFSAHDMNEFIYILSQDHRGKKKSTLSDDESEEHLMQFEDSPSHPHTPVEHSYGKDADICPSLSPDSHIMFEEEIEESNPVKSPVSPHDPWMRQSAHIPSEPTDIPSKPTSSNSPSLSDMARLGHKRTGSECLTSATEFMYSSSVDSLESLTFRNLRSPLSMSVESESFPGHQSMSPARRADFNG